MTPSKPGSDLIQVAGCPQTMPLDKDNWANLPSDILDIILSNIPLFYHPVFASVCKNWNAFCPYKMYPVDQGDPLLIHVKNWRSGFIYYYSPLWNKTFKVKSPIALQESRLFSSKNGWLVLHRKVLEENEEFEVVLINPITKISYSYPGLQRDHAFTGITFSGRPGTEDFVLFCIRTQEWNDGFVRICVWKQGEWNINRIYENDLPFSMSPDSSPVEFKNGFYCVSESGRLGVFVLEDESWNTLPDPESFSTPTFSKEMYLIESKDRIRVVVGGNHDPQVSQVFYLDGKKMSWRQIKNLGSRSMFVGPKASIMVNFDKNDEAKSGKKNSNEKVDVNGNLMNNRVYSTGIYQNVEVLEAETEIINGELFFVTKVCDHRSSKKVPRKGNIVSYSFEDHTITGKYHGVSYPLYCAWYRLESSCGLQGQEIEI